MSAAAKVREPDFEELAFSKLERVLGPAAGKRVFDETLRLVGLDGIKTADNLFSFADALSKRGGFEGAVGGLLAVTAVMRGASGHS